MSLSEGTRLGPYSIVGPLGAGGMGEVYRATDSRLKRQVAVKILPSGVAADADRLARFQREAEVLASLNHPYIAGIYGLEETDDVKALVMELVEGPTLADRIAEGPLPPDEALPIARQIAAALAAAHERGIVHRDLKPANIKVRNDGTVKVLDFGLAKLANPDASRASPLSDSATLTSPARAPAVTTLGLILGTAAYMSPEQARGRDVDKRTDIWAFGAVLYEMLTGVRAFAGDDVTETMAAVVKSTPDWAALPADTPAPVVALIQRCLEKDRTARIPDISVAQFLLSDNASIGAPPTAARPAASPLGPRRLRMLTWLLPAIALGVASGWLLGRRPAATPEISRVQMSVVPADQVTSSNISSRPVRHALAISPDGRLAVFTGIRRNVAHLYARPLDRGEATPIPGTEGGVAAFFSADGSSIGFWIGSTLKRVPLAGGQPTTIADVAEGHRGSATWADDGTIYVASGAGILRVPSAGGTPATLIASDRSKNERHVLPQALPGAKAILFTTVNGRNWDTANVVLRSVDAGEQRVLVQGGADARYVETGHLVYVKAGTLMAMPFDLRLQQVTGSPVAVVEGVMQSVNTPNSGDETGAGHFALSRSGTLLYLAGGVTPNLESSWEWLERSGGRKKVESVPTGSYVFPRLSPDGQRVAVNVRRPASRVADVWVYESPPGRSDSPHVRGQQQLPCLVARREPGGIQGQTRAERQTCISSTRTAAASPNDSRRATTHRFRPPGIGRPACSRSCSGQPSRRRASGSCRPTAGPPRRSCSSSHASPSPTLSSLPMDAGWPTSRTSPVAPRSTCGRIPVPARKCGSRRIHRTAERSRSGLRTAASSCIAASARTAGCSPQRSAPCLRFESTRRVGSSS